MPIRGGEDIPEFAADRSSGALYAVWMDGRSIQTLWRQPIRSSCESSRCAMARQADHLLLSVAAAV